MKQAGEPVFAAGASEQRSAELELKRCNVESTHITKAPEKPGAVSENDQTSSGSLPPEIFLSHKIIEQHLWILCLQLLDLGPSY